MSELLEIAEEMDELIHQSMPNPFEMPNGALLASIVINDEGVYTVTKVTESDDLYEILSEDMTAMVSKVSDYVAIITTGWASPVEEGTAPSEHPERQRVRLMIVADHSDFASVLRMQSDPEDAASRMSDGSNGPLASAMFAMLDKARRA